ncbi:MAG: hypothetical protein B7Z80_15525 [Rhodospirillales bacterium 20-64-7]|nr:MAG: hypothetical protein B7Z80_15525 [Rhodospirillales bacterium 20-64-7]
MPPTDQSDPAAAGDVQATVAAITARYEGLIAEISENRSMSQTQKAAAIVGLRYQQAQEAAGAAQAIIAQARWGSGSGQKGTRRKEQSAAHDVGDPAPSCENFGSSSDSENSTTPGAIQGLFRAAAESATRHAENPQPKPRRRRGETDKGFVPARRMVLHSGAVARGRYAVLRQVVEPADAQARACLYLEDTLEWLNLWEDNAENYNWHEEEFSAKQEQYSFQP